MASSVLPITSNLAILGGILTLFMVSILFAVKYKWTYRELTIVLLALMLLAAGLFAFPLKIAGEEVPDEEVHQTIFMHAIVKPWTFNITGWAEGNSNSSAENIQNFDESKYEEYTDENSRSRYRTLEFEAEKVYKIIIKGIGGTEHGFAIDAMTDFFGDSIDKKIGQGKEVVVYLKPGQEHVDMDDMTYRCSFFCGAGHGNMIGSITVSPAA